jgi:hypothetical protein
VTRYTTSELSSQLESVRSGKIDFALLYLSKRHSTGIMVTAHVKRSMDECSISDAPPGGNNNNKRVKEVIDGPSDHDGITKGNAPSDNLGRGADDDLIGVTTTTGRKSVVRFARPPGTLMDVPAASSDGVVVDASSSQPQPRSWYTVSGIYYQTVTGHHRSPVVSFAGGPVVFVGQQKQHQEYQYFMKERQDTVRVYMSVKGDMTHLQDHYTTRGLEHLLDTKLYIELQQCQKRLVAAVVQAHRQKLSTETIRHVSLHHSAASTRRALGKVGTVVSQQPVASSASPTRARIASPTSKPTCAQFVGTAAFAAPPPHRNYHPTNAAMTTPSVNISTLNAMNSRLLLRQLQSSVTLSLHHPPPPSSHHGRRSQPFGAVPPLTTSAGSSPRRTSMPMALLTHTTLPSLHAGAERLRPP